MKSFRINKSCKKRTQNEPKIEQKKVQLGREIGQITPINHHGVRATSSFGLSGLAAPR